ncbi:uncharacterized protein LOC132652461 isoform X4 [Meriones unguiculatus]|uniref:uncharacterized protein LOC132652461 isoform X4 n=1 Tax=Meriones unguiculatus TaxID=10047 RepID=UPI00293E2713|nr:uncharacterized protein LOC132652461 isoform X4 [Meriones unguiculatus]
MTPLRGPALRAHASVSPPPQYACVERCGQGRTAASSSRAAQHGRGAVKRVGNCRTSHTEEKRLRRGRKEAITSSLCPQAFLGAYEDLFLTLTALHPSEPERCGRLKNRTAT